MKRLLPLLLLLLVAACSPGPTRIRLDATVGVSDQWQPEQAEALLAAIDSWQAASGGRFAPTVRFGECSGCTVRIAPGDTERGWAYTDLFSDGTADIVIDPAAHGPEGQNLTTTLEHELGHAFGLDHEDGTVMVANTPKGLLPIDARTIQHFDDNYR